MYITYRDELGMVLCKVDEYGISFTDGKAYFGDTDGHNHVIPVGNLIEIQYA